MGRTESPTKYFTTSKNLAFLDRDMNIFLKFGSQLKMVKTGLQYELLNVNSS